MVNLALTTVTGYERTAEKILLDVLTYDIVNKNASQYIQNARLRLSQGGRQAKRNIPSLSKPSFMNIDVREDSLPIPSLQILRIASFFSTIHIENFVEATKLKDIGEMSANRVGIGEDEKRRFEDLNTAMSLENARSVAAQIESFESMYFNTERQSETIARLKTHGISQELLQDSATISVIAKKYNEDVQQQIEKLRLLLYLEIRKSLNM